MRKNDYHTCKNWINIFYLKNRFCSKRTDLPNQLWWRYWQKSKMEPKLLNSECMPIQWAATTTSKCRISHLSRTNHREPLSDFEQRKWYKSCKIPIDSVKQSRWQFHYKQIRLFEIKEMEMKWWSFEDFTLRMVWMVAKLVVHLLKLISLSSHSEWMAYDVVYIICIVIASKISNKYAKSREELKC